MLIWCEVKYVKLEGRTPSFKQVIICFFKKYLIDENKENPKHQKPNLKQIPMTQIQNTKQIIFLQLCPMAS